MSEIDQVKELLLKIKIEIKNQIDNTTEDTQINMGEIIKLASYAPNKLVGTDIPSETKTTLLQFAERPWGSPATRDVLQMHLDDVNMILSKFE